MARGSILVVEDEPVIRMALADHLEGQGFAVTEAGSADRAIQLIEEGAELDVVVTDVQMPGRYDGITFALWLRTHHPSIKVIVVSGIAGPAELERLGPEGILVPKPYSVQALATLAFNLITAAKRPD